MSLTPRCAESMEFVIFNGLRVEKSAVPLLVGGLVESDPLKIPDGGELEPKRRATISRVFRETLEGAPSRSLLAAIGGDPVALRYLTGLMASRS